MGNAQSPPANPRYALASRAFSQKELEDHKSLFVSLAAQSQSDGKYIFPSVFKRYFGLHGPLGDRMFDLLSQQRKDQRLSFQDLVIAKGTYEKGTKDEIEEFIYQLVDVSGDGILGELNVRSDLESVLIAMFETIFSTKDAELGPSSHKDVVDIFLNAATFSKHVDGCAEKSMSIEDFRNWCTLLPSVKKFLGSLLIPPDAGRPGSQVPCLVHLESVDSNMVLLRKEYAWHIGGALSLQELEEWKLLYHSAYNGLSFNTFLGSIS
uniref:EF-hand domain-containing protein n=1 Tax=Fagus sylvatica TaxID=28930 RepID=A0A2N9HAI7_FAGSY